MARKIFVAEPEAETLPEWTAGHTKIVDAASLQANGSFVFGDFRKEVLGLKDKPLQKKVNELSLKAERLLKVL